MIKKRSIAVNIILSLVTCGIYGFYWLYTLNEDTNKLLHATKDEMSGGMVVLLSIVTCGIFMYYWVYKQGEKLDKIDGDIDSGIFYIILTICGLGIVTYALMQNRLNKIN